MVRRRHPGDLEFIPGDAHILEGTGPLVPPNQAKQAWESMLAGRVIGSFKPVSFPDAGTPVAALINITGPDASAMAMTITLSPPPLSKPDAVAVSFFPPSVTNFDNYNPFDAAVALVAWGSGGVQSYAEIDYGRGTVFSLYCSSLQVLVRREPSVAAPNAFSPASQIWGAFASHMPTPRFSPLTRTVRSRNVIPNGGNFNEIAVIPPYAKSVRAYAVSGAGFGASAPFRLDIQDTNGFTCQSVTWVPAANGEFPEIILPNEASQISMVNTDAVNTIARWNAVFTLSL